MPYNVTVILRTTFKALKRVTLMRRRANLFQRKSLLFRSMQALTLYQMNEVKVKSLATRIEDNLKGRVFDAFIDQCLI